VAGQVPVSGFWGVRPGFEADIGLIYVF